jgi:FAD/FMN-containing dehydrogenase
MHKDLFDNLQKQIQGEVVFDEATLKQYSRDTSLFEIKPLAVLYPKNSIDISNIIKFVNDNKFNIPHLAITPRSGGSDMTGGAIGQGLIVDVTRYMSQFDIDVEGFTAQVQPGVFYRNFEPESLKHGLIMPVYPASKDLAAFGGMISNNCAGEKSLQYGQMRNFVTRLRAVLSNGQEYEFKELSFDQVQEIINGKDEFIAGIYRRAFHTIEQNYEFIKNAKPKVSKNSSGYALWDVMDKDKKTFNLGQILIGAQGTLGVISDAQIRLIKEKPFQKIITVFLPSWDKLPKLVNNILIAKPESLEIFDDTTLKLGLRFFPQIAKRINKNLFSFLIDFIPEFFVGVRMFGLPKLIMLIELSGETQEELDTKIAITETSLTANKVIFRTIPTVKEAEKYFVVRRESFNLLRKTVKNKNTAPFIEDFCILPEKLPQFLPELLVIS